MAAADILIQPEARGIYHTDNFEPKALETATGFLKLNHKSWHILWNRVRGLHNHQVHYLLTDIALGATEEQIKDAFENNRAYQQPIAASDDPGDSVNDQNFESFLGQSDKYAVWLKYFEDKVNKDGWHAVMSEFLFSGTPRADDLERRMYQGQSDMSPLENNTCKDDWSA